MAEALAVIAVLASIAQLADLGCKLSIRLYAYSQTAATADESIKGISSDVSLTSTVLQELNSLLKADESRIVSSTAIEATKQIVAECLKEFEQLDNALEKAIGNSGVTSKAKAQRGMSTFEKLRFPFKQPKLDLLRSNLDRLKASLSLMLQVLSYARDVSNRKTAESSLAYQQYLIEALARSERVAEKRYHSLQMALEYQEPPPPFNTLFSDSISPNSSRGLDVQLGPDASTAKDPPANVRPPPASQALVYELLLCFNLLNEVLPHHIATRKSMGHATSDYDELQITTNNLKIQEVKSLEYYPADISSQIQSQAAQRLAFRREKLPSSSSQSYNSPTFGSPEGPHLVSSGPPPPTPGSEGKTKSNRPQRAAPPEEHGSNVRFEDEDGVVIVKNRRAGNRTDSWKLTKKTHDLSVPAHSSLVPAQAPPVSARPELVAAHSFYHGAESFTSSSWSTAWGSMKSAGAMAGDGISNLGSEIYVAVRAGSSWLIGDDDDDDWNQYDDHKLVTENETSILRPINPKEDDDDNYASIDQDVVDDLLAKWTNLPVRKDSTEPEIVDSAETT